MTQVTAIIKTITTAAETDSKNRLPLQVGSRVVILQHKHLKCSKHGFVQYINGGYIHVRPESQPPNESDACERTFELYHGELKVLANYVHSTLVPGAVVRIKQLNWRTFKAKTHGIVTGVEAERILVQPVGAHRGAIISVLPENLQLEVNEQNLSATDLAAQVAICAILKAMGPLTLIKLRRLLGTQTGLVGDYERQVARLANAGHINLNESHATLQKLLATSVSNATGAKKLQEAVKNLADAELRLAEAVRQLILQA